MMSDPGWKQFERRIARLFGGERRGADYGGAQGGKNDCIVPGWSIECKLYGRPSYQVMLDAARQAEKAAEDSEIPIAVVKRNGDHDKNALVIMRLDTFVEWFRGSS